MTLPAQIQQAVSQTANLIKGQDPDAVAGILYNNNPQFRQFVDANKGKTPEQIAQSLNVDLSEIRKYM